jgi:hypothetical protein
MDYSYRAYLLASPEGYLAGIWLSPNQIKYPNFALRIEIHNFAELWTSAMKGQPQTIADIIWQS